AMMEPFFDVHACDESLEEIDFDHPARFIGLTGKSNQWERARKIATEFRKRGKIIIIRGSFASLSSDRVRPYCDILVRGEIEEDYSKIFKEIAEGDYQSEYIATRPQLKNQPLPDWSVYKNDRALS